MDLNRDYYNQNAQAFMQSTVDVDMQPLYVEFLPLIAKNGHILDAGCGSGRDAKNFINAGFQVTAMDASPELVKLAAENIGQPVQLKTFQQIEEINQYDAIWCCASLLHVPQTELKLVFDKLCNALKYQGVMYISFKYGKGEREHNGRRFTDLNESGLDQLLNHVTELTLHKTWQTGDQRPGREHEKWLNAILLKQG